MGEFNNESSLVNVRHSTKMAQYDSRSIVPMFVNSQRHSQRSTIATWQGSQINASCASSSAFSIFEALSNFAHRTWLILMM